MKEISYLFTIALCVISSCAIGQQGIEYWFGEDMGLGTGVFISGGENLSLSAETTGLSPGVYSICVRPRSDSGVWGLTSYQTVKIEGETIGNIIEYAEYFWDVDPGFGNGVSIDLSDIQNGTTIIQTTGLPLGDHILSLRARSDNQIWGIALQSDVTICTNYSVTAEFSFEQNALTFYISDESVFSNSVSWIIDEDETSYTESFNPTLTLEPGPHTITQFAMNECDTNEVSKNVWATGIESISGSVISTSDTVDLFIYGAFNVVSDVNLFNNLISIDPISFSHIDSTNVIHSSWIAPIGTELSVLDLSVTNAEGVSLILDQCVTVNVVETSMSSHVQGQSVFRTGSWTPFSIWVTNNGNVPAYGVPVFVTVEGDIIAKSDLEILVPELEALLTDQEYEGNEFVEGWLRNGFIEYTNSIGEVVNGCLGMVPLINPGESVSFEIELYAESGSTGGVLISTGVGGPWYGYSTSVITQGGSRDCHPWNRCVDLAIDVHQFIPGVGCGIAGMDMGCEIVNAVNGDINVWDLGVSIFDAAANCLTGGVLGTLASAAGTWYSRAKGFFGLMDDANEQANCDDCSTSADCGDEGSSDIVESIDPNDKYGPLGWGNEHWLKVEDDVMFYRIVCENYASATATAATVLFVDTLNTEKLDIETLHFHSITFADTTIVIEEDDGKFVKEVDLRPEKNSILRIDGEVDEISGVLTVIFESLDPETGAVSLDVDAGFLNPNVIPPEGEAEVSFSIEMIEGESQHGMVVENFVDIYFDANDGIRSPVWSNIFDGTPPNIQVTSAEIASDTSIYATVEGGDDDSGLRYQKVYSYDIVDGTSTLIGVFQSEELIEIDLDPTLNWNLFAIGIDGVGNVEVIDSGSSFIEFEYGPTVCVGDFNNDMFVGVDDLLIMLSAFGLANNDLSTDINGNGGIDVDDLLSFLQAFGMDCSYNL